MRRNRPHHGREVDVSNVTKFVREVRPDDFRRRAARLVGETPGASQGRESSWLFYFAGFGLQSARTVPDRAARRLERLRLSRLSNSPTASRIRTAEPTPNRVRVDSANSETLRKENWFGDMGHRRHVGLRLQLLCWALPCPADWLAPAATSVSRSSPALDVASRRCRDMPAEHVPRHNHPRTPTTLGIWDLDFGIGFEEVTREEEYFEDPAHSGRGRSIAEWA